MYLLGMFLVLLGERMIGGDDSRRWGLDGVGALCILVVLIQLGRDMMSSQIQNGSAAKPSFNVWLCSRKSVFSDLRLHHGLGHGSDGSRPDEYGGRRQAGR